MSEWIQVSNSKEIPAGKWLVATINNNGEKQIETCSAHKNIIIVGNHFDFDMPRVYAYCKQPELPKDES